jgi:hypothetical protein
MTRFFQKNDVYEMEPQVQELTAASVSEPFTIATTTFAHYSSPSIAGTLQATIDSGATWFDVATATSKANCRVFNAADFATIAALTGRSNACRISFGSAFTGTLTIVGCNR